MANSCRMSQPGVAKPEYLHRLAARGTADGRFGDRLLRCIAQ